ncbi:MAG: hypothetical protein IT210_23455 [Armatimonadetes bacterium]|nr:hypothetical protein [Armatimonadota bacterium]
MKTYLFLLSGVLLTLAGTARAAGGNLVANGDFSRLENGSPVGWEVSGNPENVTQTLQVIETKGSRFARLRCSRFRGSGGSNHAMIAQVGQARVEKGKTYEFTCRARMDGIASRSATVALQDMTDWDTCGLYTGLNLGRDWKTFRVIFRASRTVGEKSRLQFWFTETGALDLDDVRLVEIAPGSVAFTDTIPPPGGRNLVPNGSFEAGLAGWSSLGVPAGWGNMAHLHGSLQREGGNRFLRIPLGPKATPVLYFDYLKPVAQRQTRLLAARRGWIPVKKDAQYTLSCRMRSSKEGARAALAAVAADPSEDVWSYRTLQKEVRLTRSWKRYVFTFRAPVRYLFPAAGPDLESESDVAVDLDDVQLEAGDRATDYVPNSPVEISIAPSIPGGIFTPEEAPSLVVRAYNHGQSAERVRVRLSASDYFDRTLGLPSHSIRTPARGRAQSRIPLPGGWRGYYRIRAEWAAAGRRESEEIRVAIVPRRSEPDSVLGLNHAFPDNYLIRLAKKGGALWYRDWSLKWEDIEPSPGRWEWQAADTQIDRVLREGVHVMALLPPFPSSEWASEAPLELRGEGYPAIRLRQAWAPKDPSALNAFVEKAVARYRGRIRVWEFLNEPLYTSYALPGNTVAGYPGPRYDAGDYVRLLEGSASAMRRSDRGCLAMGGVGSDPEHLTGEVIEAGILKQVDLFNLHLYPGARSPEGYAAGMDRLLKRMEAGGGRKPIWITEFAYYGIDNLPRKPFIPDPGSWSEERLLESEKACADATVRFFTLMLARGVEKVLLHSGSSGAVNSPNPECPLFDYGGVPRKLLPALAVFTDLIGSRPKAVMTKSLGKEGRMVAFETGKRSLLVLWSPSRQGGRAAIRAKGTRTFDLMGRAIPPSFRLSPSPVYAVGPPGQALKMAKGLRFEG